MKYRWWHVGAVALASNALNTWGSGDFGGDDAFYEQLKRPRVAPPGWLFAPAWALNHATTAWANLRIANLPKETPGRSMYLALEGLNWGLFAAFGSLYFGCKSPKLGAADTAASLLATLGSTAIAARLDPKAALAMAPRLSWLALATYVSASVARDNPDPFLDPWWQELQAKLHDGEDFLHALATTPLPHIPDDDASLP